MKLFFSLAAFIFLSNCNTKRANQEIPTQAKPALSLSSSHDQCQQMAEILEEGHIIAVEKNDQEAFEVEYSFGKADEAPMQQLTCYYKKISHSH